MLGRAAHRSIVEYQLRSCNRTAESRPSAVAKTAATAARCPRNGSAPESFGLHYVLTLKPCDVIPVRPDGTERKRSALQRGVVRVENFFEHQVAGPCVQNEVMMCPHELMYITRQTKNSETHQRRFA